MSTNWTARVNRRAVLLGSAATLASGATLLWGCRRRVSESTRLALVPKALNNPVFELTRAGAEDRARELANVSCRWIGPTTTDAGAQSQIIDDLVVQGVDGICVSCNDPAALLPAINRAIDAGVPVITWDADSPHSRRVTYVGIDQEAAGFRAGELMTERLQRGRVAVLTGTPGALNLESRERGFMRAIARAPQVEVVAKDPCNDDVQRAVEIVEQRINATRDLAGYFFVGMWPFFADLKTMPQLKAFVAQGGVCISLDALQGALAAVHEGYATALVGYSWYGFGRTAVDVLVSHIRTGVRPPDPLLTDLFVVDATNIADYLKRQRATGGHF